MIQTNKGYNVSFNGKHVLLVDDDSRNVFALSKLLERCDVEITTAGNGLEALKHLENKRKTDLILMDMMMPEMDGYEAIDRIRQLPAYKTIPIIAVTANAMVGDQEKCLEAGANDYFSKPIDIVGLLEKIGYWLK